MTLTDRIARILSPHMGAHTADSVARHLCAKHGVGEGPVPPQTATQLRDTLRRGLVVFVGAQEADRLAQECLREPGTT